MKHTDAVIRILEVNPIEALEGWLEQLAAQGHIPLSSARLRRALRLFMILLLLILLFLTFLAERSPL